MGCRIRNQSKQSAHFGSRTIPGIPHDPFKCILVGGHLTRLLEPFGFPLREAANGQEAIDCWKEWSPHLIWMDIRMPVMNGHEATKQIRKAEEQKSGNWDKQKEGRAEHETRHTVIIGITAGHIDRDDDSVISSDYDDFLRKPFQEAEIFELLRKHLGVRFLYADEEITIEAEKNILSPNTLARLPEELLSTLYRAVECLDIDSSNRIIEQVSLHDAAVAKALALLVKEYRFDILQELLEKMRTNA